MSIFDFIPDADDISNIVKKGMGMVTQPIRDTVEVVDGLTEGELREKAVIRLGADAAGGMALSELIELYETWE